MTDTVFLHIGLLKSGTTYLQHVLWHSRHALAEEGILFPGQILGGHSLAAADLLELPDARRAAASYGAWERLLQHVREWDGSTAVVSVERLTFATKDHIRRIVDEFAPANVHVVVTVRDLARVTPSSWQERVRNRQTRTWPEFLAEITDTNRREEQPARSFWRQQDVGALLSTWAQHVPRSQITVVTVPASGGDARSLLARFAEVIGSNVSGWTTDIAERHDALGVTEAEYLRRLNTRLTRRIPTPDYDRYVKLGLARYVLGVRPAQRPVRMPDDYWPWVEREAGRIAKELADGGYRVVGDLTDLLPSPAYERAAERPVTRAELLATSFEVAGYLLIRLAEEVNAQAEEERAGQPAPLLLHPSDLQWVTDHAPALLESLRTSGHRLAGDSGSGDPPATSRPQPQDPKLRNRWILNVLLDLSADLVIRLSQEHSRRRLATGEEGVLEGEDG